MAEQLNGPERDEALRGDPGRSPGLPTSSPPPSARATTRGCATSCATVRPSDLAELLGDLSLDEQAVVFRLLPRKDAAATFEYLEQDAREALLKTLSKEDVAVAAQRHGAGRPHHVPRGAAGDGHARAARAADAAGARDRRHAARLSRKLRRPADDARLRRGAARTGPSSRCSTTSARTGRTRETLNVIYVVDDQGVLIDDIRIREFLLTDPARSVVGSHGPPLRGAEGHRRSADGGRACSASTIARRCRSPTPPASSSASSRSTTSSTSPRRRRRRDIQRIGGSEALDEPYMEIGFVEDDPEARRAG